jgi:glycosyltransferase involved in cell wall biosynthesis
MTNDSPLSIFFLVRSLQTGGAERQMVQLARELHRRGHLVRVGVFYSRGPLRADLDCCGVPVIELAKRGRWDLFGFTFRLVRALRRCRPEIIYSFLGGANLAATAANVFLRGPKLVWSIRASDMQLNRYDWTRPVLYRTECLLSPVADLIIANSYAGRDYAVSRGFSPKSLRVVPNGIDTERFRPDPQLRAQQRSKWAISDDEIAVGVLARFDPMKGHTTFIEAAAAVSKELPQARFFCIGEGPRLAEARNFAKQLGIEDRVLFPGRSDDAVSVLNGLDIYCSPSVYGEGFSNSIAEAMACGLPCVVTDVGDSARLVGDTGAVVARFDPDALAVAITTTVEQLQSNSGAAARSRVVRSFGVERMINTTLSLLHSIQ